MDIKKPITSLALAVVLMAGNSTALLADDTDIYLAPPNVIRNDSPNIMVIIDNSTSMEVSDVTIKPTYDPTTTYPAYGTGYNTGRIYWTTSSSSKPSLSTSNWISTTNMKCEAALDQLSAAAGKEGFYSDKIVQWKITSGSKGKWLAPTSGLDEIFECKTDQDSNAADSATAGTWLQDTSGGGGQVAVADRYTTNASSGQHLSFGGVTTVYLYTGNYLNYYFGTTTTTKKRMQVAREAISTVINTTSNVNMGLMVFNRNSNTTIGTGNGGGRVVSRIAPLTSTHRAGLLSIISDIRGYVVPNASFGSGSTPVGTPLAETLYEAMQYFKGASVVYGGINWDNDSGTTSTVYPKPYPDICAEDNSNSAYCAAYVYSPTVGGIDKAAWKTNYNSLSGKGTYISPFAYECQQGYIILVTDGDPYNTTSAFNTIVSGLTGGTKYSTENTATGTDTSESLSFVPGGQPNWTGDSPLDDLAGYMYNNDLIGNGTLPGIQRILTYTVGMQGINPGGEKLLKKTAEAGHGKYFDATNASALVTSLEAAIIDIQTTTSSFAAPSLSVNAFNKLFNRDEIYFALFKPSSSVQWDGNIKKLRLCNTQDVIDHGCTFGDIIDKNNVPAIDAANLRIKDTSVSFWNSVADGGTVTDGGTGLAIKAQGPEARVVHTYTDTYANLTTANNTILVSAATTATFYTQAIASYSMLDSTGAITTDAQVRKTINWMRGYTADNTAKRWPFGDPLHSRPVALTIGAENDLLGNPDPNKPIIRLFVSTNDGQIRILNDSNGQEDWAFVPKEMLDKQYTLMQDADGKHLYGADGSPTFWVEDVNQDGVLDPAAGDFAYMYVGMRRGGKNIYAFDLLAGKSTRITSQTEKLTPKLKWVIEGGVTTGYSRLGQTWSAPQIRKIKMKCNGAGCAAGDATSKTVLIFGGGYDTGQDTGNFLGAATTNPYGDQSGGLGNAVYIADPATGARIWWASSDATANLVLSQMIYAIPSDISLFDTNGDGAVDRLFFGDMGGLVWRIDLADQLDVNANGGSKGYVFADLVCKRDPSTNVRVCSDTSITTLQSWRKVFYNPDIAQVRDSVFSSTSDFDVVVVATGNRADPVDKQTINASVEAVHNRIYALRDYNVATGPYAVTAPIALDVEDIMDLTANQLQDPAAAGYAADLATIRAKKGWYIDLKETVAATVPPLTSPSTTYWVGEKGLAKPVIFDGVIYVTTYTPANDATAVITCASTEGLGKIYGLGLYNATAVIDFDGDGTADRSKNVGGGIPSELVTVIREGGVTGLVGTSGGAASPNIGEELPRGKTYWYEE